MLKDILVFLNGGPGDDARLEHAAALATSHDAHLTGLLCSIMPEMVAGGELGMAGADLIADMQRQALQQGDADEKRLRTRLDAFPVNTTMRRIDVTLDSAGRALAAEARRTDLMVGSRPYPDADNAGHLFEAALSESGSPCLFVPSHAKVKPLDKVVLAWRDTREAALALKLSMPLLAAAKEVALVLVSDRHAPEQDGEMPGADVARHLDRHGISVDLRHLSGWTDPAKAILTEAEQMGAGLIVMGGYGHSRIRQWVLGGVTRDIFHKSPIPVLMAH